MTVKCKGSFKDGVKTVATRTSYTRDENLIGKFFSTFLKVIFKTSTPHKDETVTSTKCNVFGGSKTS